MLSRFSLLLLIITGLAARLAAQPMPVAKTNPMKVYMHYMPWFETRQTTPSHDWGIHWTMGNQNPNVIDPATGHRHIASHYYPLIGPYASGDPDVLEYHLLLMKYAGMDGVLVDFYGNGANDLPLLLRNTNALAGYIGNTGLKLGMVFEDQFAATITQAQANMRYMDSAYISRPDYIQANGKPLVMVFGPQRYQTAADWTQILSALRTDPEFLTLWYESADAGSNANGEFSWVYSDYLTGLRNFYQNRASTLGTVIGSAYPGFDTFYAQGGWGGPTWSIPLDSGRTLDATLALATQQSQHMDALQLVTWNDFGEGTMLEPTAEFGYTFLEKIQAFTGVSYTVSELKLIHQMYELRKNFTGNAGAQTALNRASGFLAGLQVPPGRHIIDSLQALVAIEPDLPNHSNALAVYPNPSAGSISLSVPSEMRVGALSMYDVHGRHILSKPFETELDISALAPGLYRLELTGASRKIHARFFKR